MDKIDAIEAFVKVVARGSFCGAAGALAISPSRVTRLVQSLEDELGVALLHRTTRRVGLTDEGKAYHDRAQRLLSEWHCLDSTVRQSHQAVEGRLRVQLPTPLATSIVIPALPGLLATHPGLRPELVLERPRSPEAESADCALRFGPPTLSSAIVRRLGDAHRILCASPAYLASNDPIEAPQDLVDGHQMFLPEHALEGRTYRLPLSCGTHDVTLQIDAPPVLMIDDDCGRVAAATAGMGVLLAYRCQVATALAAETLVEVLPGWTPDSEPIYVSYPSARHLTRRVRVFIDWLAALLTAEESTRRRASAIGSSADNLPRIDDLVRNVETANERAVFAS